MKRVAIVIGLCVASTLTSRVPLGSIISLSFAALAALAAVRLDAAAGILADNGRATAALVLRASRFLHDLAIALSLLGLLYAVRPA